MWRFSTYLWSEDNSFFLPRMKIALFSPSCIERVRFIPGWKWFYHHQLRRLWRSYCHWLPRITYFFPRERDDKKIFYDETMEMFLAQLINDSLETFSVHKGNKIAWNLFRTIALYCYYIPDGKHLSDVLHNFTMIHPCLKWFRTSTDFKTGVRVPPRPVDNRRRRSIGVTEIFKSTTQISPTVRRYSLIKEARKRL